MVDTLRFLPHAKTASSYTTALGNRTDSNAPILPGNADDFLFPIVRKNDIRPSEMGQWVRNIAGAKFSFPKTFKI